MYEYTKIWHMFTFWGWSLVNRNSAVSSGPQRDYYTAHLVARGYIAFHTQIDPCVYSPAQYRRFYAILRLY